MTPKEPNDVSENPERSHERDVNEDASENSSKVEDLTKAGRENFDPNEGSD